MSYRAAKTRGDDHIAETNNPEDELMQCRWCGGMAKRIDLSMGGARCVPCYRDYLDQGVRHHGALSPDEKRAVLRKLGLIGKSAPREWAHLLKAREEAGEKLSSIQRRFWREALGVQQ